MNTQEYISSGIVESYVLGLASDEERVEFENMCTLYPEVLKAREAFELSVERLAREQAIEPPFVTKQKILQAIQSGFERDNVIAMPPADAGRIRSFNWLKFAAAASLILLAGSLYWGITLYNKNKELQSSNASLEVEVNNYTTKLAEMQTDTRVFQNPNIKMAALEGMPASPQSFATAYWDTASKDVYLLVNNLPQAPTDQQYQLWALLDGKPIDLGVFEMKQEKMIPMFRMKNAQNVQAFAITLEKKGGSLTPTPEKMYVMGKL